VGKIWSIRIGQTGYRAAADVQGGTVYWFWIGTHDNYERLIRGLEKR
jgi:hypothetical protein